MWTESRRNQLQFVLLDQLQLVRGWNPTKNRKVQLLLTAQMTENSPVFMANLELLVTMLQGPVMPSEGMPCLYSGYNTDHL